MGLHALSKDVAGIWKIHFQPGTLGSKIITSTLILIVLQILTHTDLFCLHLLYMLCLMLLSEMLESQKLKGFMRKKMQWNDSSRWDFSHLSDVLTTWCTLHSIIKRYLQILNDKKTLKHIYLLNITDIWPSCADVLINQPLQRRHNPTTNRGECSICVCLLMDFFFSVFWAQQNDIPCTSIVLGSQRWRSQNLSR